MSTTGNGGQAFPCLERGGNGLDLTDGGMSMRDYFAAKALPMVATTFYAQGVTLSDGTVPNLCAKVAYQFADAMLKARSEGGAA